VATRGRIGGGVRIRRCSERSRVRHWKARSIAILRNDIVERGAPDILKIFFNRSLIAGWERCSSRWLPENQIVGWISHHRSAVVDEVRSGHRKSYGAVCRLLRLLSAKLFFQLRRQQNVSPISFVCSHL